MPFIQGGEEVWLSFFVVGPSLRLVMPIILTGNFRLYRQKMTILYNFSPFWMGTLSEMTGLQNLC